MGEKVANYRHSCCVFWSGVSPRTSPLSQTSTHWAVLFLRHTTIPCWSMWHESSFKALSLRHKSPASRSMTRRGDIYRRENSNHYVRTHSLTLSSSRAIMSWTRCKADAATESMFWCFMCTPKVSRVIITAAQYRVELNIALEWHKSQRRRAPGWAGEDLLPLYAEI